MQTSDVIIIGAGSAGLTFALLLASNASSQHLRIQILEQGPAPSPQTPDFLRVSALNPASIRVLTQLGVWSTVTAKAAYQAMEVWEADSFASIRFDAKTAAVDTLGSIVDNEQLRQQLFAKVQAYPQIQCRFDCQINQINAAAEQNLVSLQDGSIYLGTLLVGADGAESQVRQSLQLPLTFWDYDHHALVTTLQTTLPHQATARQIFMPEGPLALLPLPDPYQCSIVWSCSPAQCAQLLALDAAAFNQRVTAASQSVLGVLEVQAPRRSFPLRMRYARQWQQHQAVLVADAAHTIHPLAGQGMNLGLMDVCALAELIHQQLDKQQSIASHRMLRHYERWRKSEAQQMIAAMELFKRGFSYAAPLPKLVRAVGMKLVDEWPFAKQHMLAVALGNRGDLPKIAQPALLAR